MNPKNHLKMPNVVNKKKHLKHHYLLHLHFATNFYHFNWHLPSFKTSMWWSMTSNIMKIGSHKSYKNHAHLNHLSFKKQQPSHKFTKPYWSIRRKKQKEKKKRKDKCWKLEPELQQFPYILLLASHIFKTIMCR